MTTVVTVKNGVLLDEDGYKVGLLKNLRDDSYKLINETEDGDPVLQLRSSIEDALVITFRGRALRIEDDDEEEPEEEDEDDEGSTISGVVTEIEVFDPSAGKKGKVVARSTHEGGDEILMSELVAAAFDGSGPLGPVNFDRFFRALTSPDGTYRGSKDGETVVSVGSTAITTKGGDDTLLNFGGSLDFKAGPGSDTIDASVMDTRVIYLADQGLGVTGAGARFTYSGVESFIGTGFDDRFTGTNKANEFVAGKGNDEATGGGGNDQLIGGGGADSLDGEGGSDRVSGGSGADSLNGGDGKDTVDGGGGNDMLFGGGQADVLRGGGGKDTMDGGAGADTLTGGKGADTFVFGPDGGKDVVTDFKVGQDVVALAAGFDLGDVSIRRGEDFIRLILKDDDGDVLSTMTFEGVFPEAIVMGDFF